MSGIHSGVPMRMDGGSVACLEGFKNFFVQLNGEEFRLSNCKSDYILAYWESCGLSSPSTSAACFSLHTFESPSSATVYTQTFNINFYLTIFYKFKRQLSYLWFR